MVMSLAEGGGGYPFFAECFYNYICGDNIHDIKVPVDVVADESIYTLLKKVNII